ncbi:nitric oxide reductase subunit C [Methylomarinovum tepidoasis]|uniref:Nitric oxide reductase subunit C n=1 Tax=Methylomarinovum tepidoasis TaxID=2840183 RepID=A0AAU9CT84_9GAMM|nr:cytochrome c [Methylomarinovum sp. IN45]BCX89583.1 nitric oxide reductase subunit C [Methylomarinovum sp. IN45]
MTTSSTPWWASTSFWKKTAIWVTAGSFLVLIGLTFDTMAKIQAGSRRVPNYTVINRHIDYRYDSKKHHFVPVIGGEAPLFGKRLSVEEAEKLVTLGKKTIQARNCMNCHTLLGNGAYYAPDLTKAWLDPAWGPENARPMLMKLFLMDPEGNARTYGSGRKMPNLGITEKEAEGIIAFLKWMSAIDTNGFPYNFRTAEGG